jgi:demethylmenaquinone methyltransferase/2-methoxy-6-polyprenyl-1,4-benzoquinol methylase
MVALMSQPIDKAPRGPRPAGQEKTVGRRDEATVPFGFRRVRSVEKAPLVRGVFDRVATRYDLTFRFLERIGLPDSDPERTAAIVCDVNQSMLSVGRDRALDRGHLGGLRWVCGNAEALPIADASFDAYTIAVGLRNVTNHARALAEARRVLRPGGRFLCLEFSRVALPLLAPLYDLYSFRLLPALGQAVTGDGDAYRYLVESIRRFPPQEALAAMIAEAGLDRVKFRNLSGGICALHSAWRL